MFLIYFNNFPLFLDNAVTCIEYANDATVVMTGDLGTVKAESEKMLERAKRWCKANELCLNDNKTVELVVGLSRSAVQENKTKSTKMLGVTLSAPNLNFKEHVANISSVIISNIFALQKLKNILSPDIVRVSVFFVGAVCDENYYMIYLLYELL